MLVAIAAGIVFGLTNRAGDGVATGDRGLAADDQRCDGRFKREEERPQAVLPGR